MGGTQEESVRTLVPNSECPQEGTLTINFLTPLRLKFDNHLQAQSFFLVDKERHTDMTYYPANTSVVSKDSGTFTECRMKRAKPGS